MPESFPAEFEPPFWIALDRAVAENEIRTEDAARQRIDRVAREHPGRLVQVFDRHGREVAQARYTLGERQSRSEA